MDVDSSHQSPNHSARDGAAIQILCLHATVGSFASSLRWLCNPQTAQPGKRVSTHYLIDRDGAIHQLVPDNRAAWHAGTSSWGGRTSAQIQAGSIGIELVNLNTGHDPYPPAQLTALHTLCASLIARYDIRRANVVRHLDIATPAGRKSDPAGFPFPSFVASLYPARPAVTVPTMPAPGAAYNPARYRVVDIRISQRQIGGPPYAGTLAAGALIEIDTIYPNQMCHLKDGSGFLPLSALEPAGVL